MWQAVRSCCCLAFLLGWESCPRIISEQEPFLPQVDFIRGFLPQQQKETRAGFRAPLPAVSKDSDFLVLHDSGFISNLSWASASKKYHKNEWSEKWNKGKQTHKMQASFLLLVFKRQSQIYEVAANISEWWFSEGMNSPHSHDCFGVAPSSSAHTDSSTAVALVCPAGREPQCWVGCCFGSLSDGVQSRTCKILNAPQLGDMMVTRFKCLDS